MEKYKGYTYEIEHDEFVYDPLTDSTPEERGAWFLLKHNRYDLPFELDIDMDKFDSWTALAKATKKPYKFVRWYEHSGIAVSLRDDESGQDWDAGIAGVIVGNTTDEIESAFADWKCYIEGDIWQVHIVDPYGDTPEDDGDMSGIFGYEYAVDFAEQRIDLEENSINYATKAKHAGELHR